MHIVRRHLERHWEFFNKTNSKKLVLFFQGKSGIGKTQTIVDFCNEKEVGIHIVNLTAFESIDFTGKQIIENGLTTYAKPKILALEEGILFLDELNRVKDQDVKSCLLTVKTWSRWLSFPTGYQLLGYTILGTTAEELHLSSFTKCV